MAPVLYDFRRPIQLSREHARTLQIGLDGFARQATTVFTSSLRTVCSVTLVSVEQRSYGEYVESLGSSTYLTMFTADPIPGVGVFEMPVPATMLCIDHMLGGPGGPGQPSRPLTEIESAVMRRFVERLLGEMRYSLEGIVALEPVITGVEYSPQFAQAAGAADVMVVATFDLKVGELDHRLTFCLPFSGLMPHLVHASAPTPASDRERLQRAHAAALLQEQFHEVPVDVRVTFRSTRVAPGEISNLRVGDVVRLSHPSAAPLDVAVDDMVFAHATPGVRGRRLAAQIVATPPPGTPKENR
ncbi:MAG: flagellar motor switch protein FliM [Nocardioidaceae bacterium]|nr:flagellar motor switch protein FliM [Nocardioidaceae bacterium]